jgi:hypothetical protein
MVTIGFSPIKSGNFVYYPETGKVIHLQNEKVDPGISTVELIENGGFETGELPPWESEYSYWFVTTEQPHSGTYCASDTGNHWIMQFITHTPTDSIQSVTFWSRQPEEAIQAFRFLFDDDTFLEDIVWPQDTWQQFDVTSYLPSGKTLIAFRLWGYSGGGSLPDITFIDDISIETNVPTDISERVDKSDGLALKIKPNPARSRVEIEFLGVGGTWKKVSIYNSSGQLVRSVKTLDDHFLWIPTNVEPGVYFVTVGVNGRSLVGKIVISGK